MLTTGVTDISSQWTLFFCFQLLINNYLRNYANNSDTENKQVTLCTLGTFTFPVSVYV